MPRLRHVGAICDDECWCETYAGEILRRRIISIEKKIMNCMEREGFLDFGVGREEDVQYWDEEEGEVEARREAGCGAEAER